MRVIAGVYRGRRFDRIEGTDIRPTSDMVKESLFNILSSDIIESKFLDLFGGTGGVGIEALSRGASHVVFIDSSIKSIKVLRKNLENLNIIDNIEVYNTDYLTAISKLYKNNKKFNIIFIDPPYSTGIAQKALLEISRNCILDEPGIIIIEHDAKDDMPETAGKLNKYRSKQYGNTKLSFYTLNEQMQHKEE
ncbi:MAG: 16S rRNA (guanine(966)-N(2))-methyltransferase RsmD [Caulobacteraceae bacterium]